MTEEDASPRSSNAIHSFAAVLDLFGLVKANVSSAIALADMLRARRQTADLRASMDSLAILRSTQYTTLTSDHIDRLCKRNPSELREIIVHDFTRLKVATDGAIESFNTIAKLLNYSNPRLVAEVEHALHQRVILLEQVLMSRDPEYHLSSDRLTEVYNQYRALYGELLELLESLSKEIGKRAL
jgi:hypothetical protein